MKQSKIIRSISSVSVMMMEESALNRYTEMVGFNLRNHVSVDELDYTPAISHEMVRIHEDGSKDIYELAEDGKLLRHTGEYDDDGNERMEDAPVIEQTDKQILVFHLDGPVMRYGGMCSTGSQQIRDMLMQFADDPSVVGMKLITDTPGGDAYAMMDMRDGMAAWDAAGKRSAQFIDGQCLSAGVAMGCQTQRVIAFSDACEVGCVGAMCAGWATPDGAKATDGSRYVNIVAKQTPEKNLIFREAAKGNYEKITEWVSASAQEFLDMLDAHRPNIPSDMKKGQVYSASECVGNFIDAIASEDDVDTYLLTGEEPWKSSSTSAAPSLPSPDGTGASSQSASSNISTQKAITMKTEDFKKILSLEELHVQEDGIFLNAELVDQTVELFAQATQKATDALANAEDFKKKFEEAQTKLAEMEALQTKLAETEQKFNKANEDLVAALAAKEELNKNLTAKETALTQTTDDLNKAKAQVTDLQNKVTKLEEENQQLSQQGTDPNLPTPSVQQAQAQGEQKPFMECDYAEKRARWGLDK